MKHFVNVKNVFLHIKSFQWLTLLLLANHLSIWHYNIHHSYISCKLLQYVKAWPSASVFSYIFPSSPLGHLLQCIHQLGSQTQLPVLRSDWQRCHVTMPVVSVAFRFTHDWMRIWTHFRCSIFLRNLHKDNFHKPTCKIRYGLLY